MTVNDAEQYAKRMFDRFIGPVSIMSEETSELVKDRLAHAYMDGGLDVANSLALDLLAETHAQRIERGNREAVNADS